MTSPRHLLVIRQEALLNSGSNPKYDTSKVKYYTSWTKNNYSKHSTQLNPLYHKSRRRRRTLHRVNLWGINIISNQQWMHRWTDTRFWRLVDKTKTTPYFGLSINHLNINDFCIVFQPERACSHCARWTLPAQTAVACVCVFLWVYYLFKAVFLFHVLRFGFSSIVDLQYSYYYILFDFFSFWRVYSSVFFSYKSYLLISVLLFST